jgi:membrane protein YdbS with pleckstrin-like domain
MTDDVERAVAGPAEDAATATTPSSHVADDVEHPLDPRSIAASRASGAIVLAIIAAVNMVSLAGMLVAGTAFVWILLVLAICGVVLALVGALIWFWPALRYRHAAYRVNERGIQIKDGVLWRSVVSVPRSRVQHTDVSQGPLARAYGLATLVIHTAGTEHASVTLDGLARDTAYAIRDHLIDSGDGDAV